MQILVAPRVKTWLNVKEPQSERADVTTIDNRAVN